MSPARIFSITSVKRSRYCASFQLSLTSVKEKSPERVCVASQCSTSALVISAGAL